MKYEVYPKEFDPVFNKDLKPEIVDLDPEQLPVGVWIRQVVEDKEDDTN